MNKTENTVDIDNIHKKTANATKWSTISEIIAKLIVPITNMVLARLLTPESFGVVATVNMIVSFSDMFSDAGFQKYLIQHDFKNKKVLDEHTNVAFWTNFTISIIIWIIICIFCKPISIAVGNPGLEKVIIVASASLPLTSFSSIQMARFKREFNFKVLVPIRFISVIISFCVTIPLAFAFHSYWALIISTIIGNLINALLLTIKSEWKPRFYYNFSILKEMFIYSWWILLESISFWATTYIDTFIVGCFLSIYYVGLYKTAMSTVNQIMGLITAATSLPLFVALSRLKNNKIALEKTYLEYIRAISCFIIPMGVGIWFYRSLVVQILLGNQWTEATTFVGLWGLIYAISIVWGSYCNSLYNAVGKTYLSFLSQILQLIVLVPVLIVFVKRGYQSLFIARSFIRLEIIFVQFFIMRIVMKIRVIDQIKMVIPASFCSIIMVIVAMILRNILSDSIYWQCFSVLICIAVYFIIMNLFFKRIFIDTMILLGLKKQ
ncbi:lipopolysaccharide biosynthesis protein [Enterococcus faecium]|uniref:lipopolysaccharide biosynthesis protein n=1 Tax=Enterococcus faecium TaxID=1352 RepID=UPI00202D086D|nr:lipopolysaccharide biosynthesis protein [Enterococcus faecium]MCL9978146.1 lipopolysaccharide biosynthesis protein [Enterococcus faecium]